MEYTIIYAPRECWTWSRQSRVARYVSAPIVNGWIRFGMKFSNWLCTHLQRQQKKRSNVLELLPMCRGLDEEKKVFSAWRPEHNGLSLPRRRRAESPWRNILLVSLGIQRQKFLSWLSLSLSFSTSTFLSFYYRARGTKKWTSSTNFWTISYHRKVGENRDTAAILQASLNQPFL